MPDYVMVCAAKVDDPFKAESRIHTFFADQRVDPRREFFRATAEEARVIALVAKVGGTAVADPMENEVDAVGVAIGFRAAPAAAAASSVAPAFLAAPAAAPAAAAASSVAPATTASPAAAPACIAASTLPLAAAATAEGMEGPTDRHIHVPTHTHWVKGGSTILSLIQMGVM
jgi:hypothetical protein